MHDDIDQQTALTGVYYILPDFTVKDPVAEVTWFSKGASRRSEEEREE